VSCTLANSSPVHKALHLKPGKASVTVCIVDRRSSGGSPGQVRSNEGLHNSKIVSSQPRIPKYAIHKASMGHAQRLVHAEFLNYPPHSQKQIPLPRMTKRLSASRYSRYMSTLTVPVSQRVAWTPRFESGAPNLFSTRHPRSRGNLQSHYAPSVCIRGQC